MALERALETASALLGPEAFQAAFDVRATGSAGPQRRLQTLM